VIHPPLVFPGLPNHITSTLVYYFQARPEPTRVESLMGLYSNGMILALPTSIRLGQTWIEVTNTQAYHDKATITAIKSFIQGQRGRIHNTLFSP
jgi:hypothetical protein